MTLWSKGFIHCALGTDLLGTGVRKCHLIENTEQTCLCSGPHHPVGDPGEELQSAGGRDVREERSCVDSYDSSRNWSQYTSVHSNLNTAVQDGQALDPLRPKTERPTGRCRIVECNLGQEHHPALGVRK